MMVQRYEVITNCHGDESAFENDEGRWVKFTDYAALEADCQERVELALKSEMRFGDKRYEELAFKTQRITADLGVARVQLEMLRAAIREGLEHVIVGSPLHRILTGAMGLPVDYNPQEQFA